ncbi:MAG: hypothetical protein P8Y01_00620 [Woeseiaceae bacterium]|jgi:hypothetical protein
MFGLVKALDTNTLLYHQLPTLGASLMIAELAYKSGSFSLEAIAFLATWFVLGYGLVRLTLSY